MSFTREYPVKAVRKRRRCDACPGYINIGEPAVRWAGFSEGDFQTAIWHPECRKAEIAFNRLKDTMWHDEWSSLSEMEDDDHPWLLEEYPAIAARYGITAETIAAEQEPSA